LNQKAKRPAKTGFILDKAKRILNFSPRSFNASLEIIEEQLRIKNEKK
jgi:dTDP-4-dehydrorhamnose reductase